MQYFNNIRANGGSTQTASRAQQAVDFLDGAARTRDLAANTERDRLHQSRELGGLAGSTSNESIDDYSSRVGYYHQATSIVHGNPTRDALTFMAQQVDAAQHPNGATWTNKHGDMRNYKKASAAKQRGSNTGLTNPESLHGTADNDDDEEDARFAREMEEAARRSRELGDEEEATRRSLEDQQLALATQASMMQQQPTPYNNNQQRNLNEHMRATMMGMPPPPPAAAAVATGGAALPPTPAVAPDAVDETPEIDVEVREDAMMKIVMGEDEESSEALQRVYAGLTEKPRDAQIQKGNALMHKKGKGASERLAGLVKLEEIRMKNEKKK